MFDGGDRNEKTLNFLNPILVTIFGQKQVEYRTLCAKTGIKLILSPTNPVSSHTGLPSHDNDQF